MSKRYHPFHPYMYPSNLSTSLNVEFVSHGSPPGITGAWECGHGEIQAHLSQVLKRTLSMLGKESLGPIPLWNPLEHDVSLRFRDLSLQSWSHEPLPEVGMSDPCTCKARRQLSRHPLSWLSWMIFKFLCEHKCSPISQSVNQNTFCVSVIFFSYWFCSIRLRWSISRFRVGILCFQPLT